MKAHGQHETQDRRSGLPSRPRAGGGARPGVGGGAPSVYFDNAATSNPKPPQVLEAMEHYMKKVCASPGRGGYRWSLDAGRIVYQARAKVRELFNAPALESVAFTMNVTYALNCAIQGLVRPGDHVVTTSVEHNSVIRPLRFMQEAYGIQVTVVQCDGRGMLDPDDVRRAMRPETRTVVMTHASNVVGSVLPVAEVGRVAQEFGAFFIVDTAQTAGVLDIDFAAIGADVLAFTGHKSLMGPPGTGGFVVSSRAAGEMRPLVHGGTGSRSHLETQPEDLPDKFESGTMNTVGIAGLAAGIEFVLSTGLERICEHERSLARRFVDGVREIGGFKLYGPEAPGQRVATVSVGAERGADLANLAYRLDAEYGVMVRSGLHCSPLAHRTIGTFPEGTLRFSFGYFNTEDEVDYAVRALAALATTDM